MNLTKLLTVIAAILFMFACAYAQDVHYNYDRSANFTTYKTYQWVDEPTDQAKLGPPSGLPKIDLPGGGPLAVSGGTSDDQLIRQDIQRAVDEQLAQKGLTKVDQDNADLYVGYQAAVGQEKQFTSYSDSWGPGGGWYGGGWYGGGGMTTTTGQTSTIYVGQLALDMYDSANKDLVWRGVASKTIDPKAKPEKQQKNLAKAVSKLLKNYPPPQKKS